MPRKLVVLLLGVALLPACGDSRSPSAPSAPAPPPPAPPPAPTETTITINSTDIPKEIANLSRSTSTLTVTAAGTILEVSASVNVSHTWRGDLDVRLLHPDGTTADLFIGNPADSTDNVVDTYTVTNAPTLGRLLNKPSAGTWRLQIDDTQPQDKGTLNSWSLRLRIRQ